MNRDTFLEVVVPSLAQYLDVAAFCQLRGEWWLMAAWKVDLTLIEKDMLAEVTHEEKTLLAHEQPVNGFVAVVKALSWWSLRDIGWTGWQVSC